MHLPAVLQHSPAELEASLLGVLLSAETMRDGANALLVALRPALEDVTSAAIAVRDRDGLTLHVLAETGELQLWPTHLEPQLALGGAPSVDAGTATLVAPLRAGGRVIGALLLSDAPRAGQMLREGDLAGALDTVAAVLHSLASRLDVELRRRAVSVRSIDSILDGMAHQIANPLTGASAIAQLLIEDLQDQGQRAAVAQIRQELARTFTVLRDMLEFHRDTRAQDGVLDLNSVAEAMVRFRGYAIREKGIALDLDTVASFVPVRSDTRGLEHAVLVALRFAELRSHGTVNRCIGVRVVERKAGEVAIEITDSGPGDTPEVFPAYFDLPLTDVGHPAREGNSETPDLGLVESILRGCGGRLEVRGSKATGTTLALVFPRAYTAQSTIDGRASA